MGEGSREKGWREGGEGRKEGKRKEAKGKSPAPSLIPGPSEGGVVKR